MVSRRLVKRGQRAVLLGEDTLAVVAIKVNRGQRVVPVGGATLAVDHLVGVEGEEEAGRTNGRVYMHGEAFLFTKIYA
jgi:hypothetical protein